jgi:hypothetical protein
MHTVGVLYFGLFNTLEYNPLHFYPHPNFSAAFNAHLITLPSHLTLYSISFSSLFPQISLLQKCSTTEFV